MEHLLVDGYIEFGHFGMIRSFIRDGFVWQMLAVIEPGSGATSDAHTFFRSSE